MISDIKISDPIREKKNLSDRLFAMILIILITTFVIIVRLFFLQIIYFSKYKTLSNKNQWAIIPIEPKRGLIYDRNGKILANNYPSYNLEVIPQYAPTLKKTLLHLNNYIDLPQSEITKIILKQKKQRPFESIIIKTDLSEDELAKISAELPSLPGVKIAATLNRIYPYNEIASHILGYTGLITPDEAIKLNQSNYLPNQLIGKTGIEKYYEEILHGNIGYKQVEIDSKGKIVKTINNVAPKAGREIHLTIDIDLQAKALQALNNKSGAIVVISKTGEILALVSSPTFNPNTLANNTTTTTNKSQFNRAITGLYPMASTIKPFLALQGLDKQVIDPSYKIFDPGWYKLPNNDTIFHDIGWQYGGHGHINLTEAITVSCDTFFYNLANLLGIESIEKTLHVFGFGEKTNIDLFNESQGLVPNPIWKKKYKHENWYAGDTVITGIGQGSLLVTPLQLANATMTLAQKGAMFKPHVVSRFSHMDNTYIELKPTQIKQIILKNNNSWNVVHNAMRKVITSPYGSGRAFGNIQTYTVAGKTGTAQVFSSQIYKKLNSNSAPLHLKDHSLFIAFAPFDKPEIAIAVIVEHSKGAVLVARTILDAYFDQKKTSK